MLRLSKALLALLLISFALPSPAQDVRSRLKGLVYEAEDWAEPKSAWEKDKRSPDKWDLWTTEGKGKRSGDQSLVSPKIEKDRATPEEGAPPLHMHITGIPANTYVAYLGPANRPMAFSLDGKQWDRTQGGETCLGLFEIKDGTFDLWADDRYANPANIGSCYFDYVRLEPTPPIQYHDLQAFTLPDGTTQLSWYTNAPVPCVVEYGEGDRFDRTVEANKTVLRNYRVILADLTPGRAYQARVCMKIGGRVSGASPAIRFLAGARPVIAASKPAALRLTVAEPTPAPRKQWPVTSGVPFPKGMLAGAKDVILKDTKGAAVPAQFEALSFWPDGSVKWLTTSFLADTNPSASTSYDLDVASGVGKAQPGDVRVEEGSDGIILSNAKIRFKLARKSFALFDDVRLDRNGDGVFAEDERVSGAPDIGNIRIIAADGTAYGLADPDKIAIEEKGPVRAIVRVEGDFMSAGKKLFCYRLRITLYSQQPFFGVNVTVGDNNITQPLTPLRGAGLRIPVASSGPLRGSIDGSPMMDIKGENDLALLQDYDARFTRSVNGQEQKGERALGIAQAEAGGVTVSAFVKDFWQTYPKGLTVQPDGFHVRLLPPLPKDQYTSPEDTRNFISLLYWCRDGLYEFRQGLEYTADVCVRFDTAPNPPATLAAHLQNPLFAVAEPRAYCDSGAFGPVDPQVPGEFDDYSAMVEAGFQGVEKSRQDRHEYGWMNFGDWFGERKYNWGNSEYDLAWCMALQFARTGDLKYLRRGEEMTRHCTTIDTLHYPAESTAPGVVYAHCAGHVGGFFEKRDPRFSPAQWKSSYGEGFLAGVVDPGGHIYQPGNFTYGFLMGDRRFLEVAERVVAQQATYFTRSFDFGIERGAGWPLINAVTAYRETNNPFYLNAARIYLEKIFEKQDPVTGGWRMPQTKGECDCPDAGKESHMGGKAFAAGILLHGLILYDQTCPSPEVKESIVRGADWLMNYSWNKEKLGFRYKTGCPKYQNDASVGGTGSLVADGIAYAYEITKDAKYKDFLLSWLDRVMKYTDTKAKPPATVIRAARDGKSYAQLVRQTAFALHYIRTWGFKELPKPVEPPAGVKPK